MKKNGLPLVSVIIPIYMIERYIGLCIESLLNQDYENLEIILVDDGSQDRCPEICDLYAEKDCRISVIHKQNGGLVSARKAGIEASSGEYIANVDGDDWVDSGFISSLVEALLISGADAAVAGQERVFFGKTKQLLNTIPFGVYEGENLELFFGKMISTSSFFDLGIFTYVWNKLFKREVLYHAQMSVDNRISIGEDAACVYPALLACKRIVVTSNCSYYYRQREDSMLKKSAPFEKEAPYIKILYDYMISAMGYKDDLMEQIKDYVLSIFIIRSGGLLPTGNEISNTFPFGIDLKGKRVAIYSAGTFGQHLRDRLKEANHCNVVGWFDEDYWEYRRCCLDVDPVEEVKKTDFDFLLLAVINTAVAQKTKIKIMDMGIPQEKILIIKCVKIKEEALNTYLDFSEKKKLRTEHAAMI